MYVGDVNAERGSCAVVQQLARAIFAGERGRCAAGSKAKGEGVGELKRCSRCRSASYCSVECQRADWQLHRQVCRPAE